MGIRKGADPDKEAYSGFEGTDLASRLRRHGVKRVVVAGLTTDYCVKTTVLDAIRNGFRAAVVTDAIKPVEVKPGDAQAALVDMRRAGAEMIKSGDLE